MASLPPSLRRELSDEGREALLNALVIAEEPTSSSEGAILDNQPRPRVAQWSGRTTEAFDVDELDGVLRGFRLDDTVDTGTDGHMANFSTTATAGTVDHRHDGYLPSMANALAKAEAEAEAEAEVTNLKLHRRLMLPTVDLKYGDAVLFQGVESAALVAVSDWFRLALVPKADERSFREHVEGVYDFEGNPAVPLTGFDNAIRWVQLQDAVRRNELVAALDGDDVVPTLMSSRYFGMHELFDGVQRRMMEGVDEENCLSILSLADTLEARALQDYCSAFCLQRLESLESQSAWQEVSPEIRQTLRCLKIQRDASERYGLAGDAFADLRELVAMMREQLRDQRERHAESVELARQDEMELAEKLRKRSPHSPESTIAASVARACRKSRTLLEAQRARILELEEYIEWQVRIIEQKASV